ncbi:hypothetical protein SteCoe_12625 [Stentor coeruleus]|uniref:Phospholipid-transporting ATPase n=1 Tax=Stentor coeruleus TaxID=5963 RepID=A0A1R2CA99_9CILI|nr:hypothetical protein SteCoe_12625 [Stentor coeruleus]
MKDPLVDEHHEQSPPSKRYIEIPVPNPKLYIANSISTSKYNFFTFLPKNLFEQFSKSANVYFLIIAVLQSIPQISVTGGIPNILMPLSFVLTVSAIKDLLEDLKRKKSDRDENYRLSCKWNEGEWIKEKWLNLKVGDIVRVEKDECFPADLVILTSSENKGIAYIETKNLDGETNLKHKLAHKYTQAFFQNEKKFDRITGGVECEEPNAMIYQFNGILILGETAIALSSEQFLLRGCSLKNTDWIIGIAVYTGHQTKIMLNSSKARSKTSQLESHMNREIVYIFLMQLVLCAVCAVYYTTWYSENRDTTDIYLRLNENSSTSDAMVQFVIQFFSWMLIFTNFVPISLLVTLEMVRFMQAGFISKDIKIYYEPNDIPTGVQSSSLNEELGQINYVFSDKTGTLTRNVMEFRKMSIHGMSFGTNDHFTGPNKIQHVDFIDENFDPNDRIYYDFIIHLAVCHTVIGEVKNGVIEFKASSPDELALVNAAKFFGIEFIGRDSDQNIQLMIQGEKVSVAVMNVLEFTSDRKRMSVVVRMPDGRIKLLCKGADTILQPRMLPSDVWDETWKLLENFANEGLRTLVLAERELSESEYCTWNDHYNDALRDILNREQRMAEVGEMIETHLELVGATAIEDMLQEKVPQTIKTLREAGIKIWVLTGDKIETAINIAFSCNLISHDMIRIIIDSRTGPEVKKELENGLLTLKAQHTGTFALVISGEALIRAMAKDLVSIFIKVAERCSAVVCCRVSPQQKADVVKLVRDCKPHVRTLSIGDGANDVNMITAAHVGIGIAGLEGQQAVRASDYAVGQFCYLQRLLFVHGRECYRRNANLICYNFYKNVLLVIPLFYYGMFSAYSGQLIYNLWTYQLFNIIFAAMPIVIYAVFDKEIPYFELETIPTYYKLGLQGELFSTSIFWFWILEAFCQGLVIVLLSLFTLSWSTGDKEYGQMENMWVSAILIFALIVVFVNLKIIAFSYSHYWFSILILILSTGSFFFCTIMITEYLPIISWLDNYDSRGSSTRIMYNPNTYSGIVIAIFFGFFLKPIYDAYISIKAMMKKDTIAPEDNVLKTEEKDDIGELLPDEIILAEEAIKAYNRPHTGFAFSGEAGHTPQITDPGFFL